MYSTESRQLNRAAHCSPRGAYFFSPCIARANPLFKVLILDAQNCGREHLRHADIHKRTKGTPFPGAVRRRVQIFILNGIYFEFLYKIIESLILIHFELLINSVHRNLSIRQRGDCIKETGFFKWLSFHGKILVGLIIICRISHIKHTYGLPAFRQIQQVTCFLFIKIADPCCPQAKACGLHHHVCCHYGSDSRTFRISPIYISWKSFFG